MNAVTSGIVIEVPRGGTISGKVISAREHLPLADMDIDVFDLLGARIPLTARTDASGHYLLGALPAGDYLVRADSWLGQNYSALYHSNAIFELDATPVTVTVGSDTGGIDFALNQGAAIQGVLTASNGGAPAPGIDMDVFDPKGRFYSIADAVSSVTGFYRLTLMPPGDWIVQADPTVQQGYVDEYYDGEYALTRASIVTLSSGQSVGGVDIALDPGGTISGTIRISGTDEPLMDARVRSFFTDGMNIDVAAKSDATGTYTLGLLPVGQYLIMAEPPADLGLVAEYYNEVTDITAASLVDVTVGQDHPGIDFHLDSNSTNTPTDTPTDVPTNTPTPRAGDLNNDGVLDVLDVFVFSSQWQQTESSVADLDANGSVNAEDLLRLISMID